MCDPLRKNLLLPSWFAEDFKEESSASLLGICFLGVLGSLGKNILLPYLRYFGVWNSLGKNLLPPPWGWCSICLNY